MSNTSEEHLADLGKAMAALDKATRQLIADEPGEAWPALEAAEDLGRRRAAGGLHRPG